MAYGAECLDSQGRTIFNSNNPCELVLWEGTATTANQAGAAINGQIGRIRLPDYCFGHDLGTEVSNTTFQMKKTLPAAAPSGGIYNVQLVALSYLSSLAKEVYINAATSTTPPAFTESTDAPLSPGNPVSGNVGFNEFVTNYSVVAFAFIDAKVNWQLSNSVYEKEAWIESFKVYNVQKVSGTYVYDHAYIVWKVRGSTSVAHPTYAQENNRSGYQNIQTGDSSNNVFNVRFTIFEMVKIVPEIWIRPQSQAHSFSLMRPASTHPSQTYLDPRTYITGNLSGSDVSANELRFYNSDYWLYTDYRGSNITWDVKVTAPADVWGKTGTGRDKKYADSSNKTHGLECYDAGTTGWGTQTAEQKTTYSSLAKVAKESGFAQGKGNLPRNNVNGTSITGAWQANPSLTASGAFVLHNGTVAAHPLKYYCRMNGTMTLCQGTGTHNKGSPWTWQYKWYGNNHIKSEWRYVPYIDSNNNLQYPYAVLNQFFDSTVAYMVATFGEPI